MKVLFLSALSVMFLATDYVSANELADDAQLIFAKVSSSVATITSLDAQAHTEVQGSGVVVGPGLIASNCHVIEEAASIRVQVQQIEMPGVWTHRLAGLDLCLIKVEGLKAAILPLRRSDSLKVGEPVYAVGNPLGFGVGVSKGLIATVKQHNPYPQIVATAALSPGSSGGGLFDADARLIGITTAVMGNGQNMNMIIAADGIKTLIEKGEVRRPIKQLPAAERTWQDEADALQRADNWDALEKLSSNWQRAQPSSAWPLAFMGLAQIQLKRYAEAQANLRKALVLDPNLTFIWVNLADALENMGQSADAEQALQQAETLMPNYPEPGRIRAGWYKKQGKLAAALIQVQESIRKDPGRSHVWLLLGEIENAMGHKEQALQAFTTGARLANADAEAKRGLAKLSKHSIEADKISGLVGKGDDADKVDPSQNESRALLEIAASEKNQGHLVPAEHAIRKALALTPKSQYAWNNLGDVLFASKRYVEAEDAFTKSIQLDSKDPHALVNRALTYQARKQMDLALKDATSAITLFPADERAWTVYADIKFELRDYTQAHLAYAKLDQMTQLRPDALVSWAESLIAIGQPESAQKLLLKAETLKPNLPRMMLSMAKILGQKGDIEGALRYENRVLEVDPTSVHAWSGKGYALMKLNRIPEAIEALETAVRLDPEITNAWINLGEAQMRKQSFARAIESLEKALVLTPSAMDARLYLAQSYLSVRQPKKSLEQAQKLLDKKADYVPALSLMTVAYLMDGNQAAATPMYLKLKALAPAIAHTVRERAISGGLAGARNLQE